MRVATIGWVGLMGIAIASPGGASAADAAAVAACIDRMAVASAFSGTALVRTRDWTVERSFGVVEPTTARAIDETTAFNVASAGKMFTAVAIGRLVDRGTIRFDAPIGRYLEGLDPAVASITVAQLLEHTSGLGNHFDPANAAAIATARTMTDLLPLALRDPPAFVAGSRRAYSNAGFIVLGALVEQRTGLSYDAFVRAEILVPLGMRRTRFDMQAAAVPMTRLSGTGTPTTLHPTPAWLLRSSSAGGIVSTPGDLSTFLRALDDDRLLRRETRDALFAPRADPAGGPGTYGYGFDVRVAPRLRVGHGGGAPGINAEVALFPASGGQIVVLSNGDPPTATRVARVLERVLFDDDSDGACTMPNA